MHLSGWPGETAEKSVCVCGCVCVGGGGGGGGGVYTLVLVVALVEAQEITYKNPERGPFSAFGAIRSGAIGSMGDAAI